jgi:hypothetical protein
MDFTEACEAAARGNQNVYQVGTDKRIRVCNGSFWFNTKTPKLADIQAQHEIRKEDPAKLVEELREAAKEYVFQEKNRLIQLLNRAADYIESTIKK